MNFNGFNVLKRTFEGFICKHNMTLKVRRERTSPLIDNRLVTVRGPPRPLDLWKFACGAHQPGGSLLAWSLRADRLVFGDYEAAV